MKNNACHADALERLRAARFDVAEVYQVEPEAILYLTSKGVPMTAWSFLRDEKIFYLVESGFPAEPSERILKSLEAE